MLDDSTTANARHQTAGKFDNMLGVNANNLKNVK
jgi:hypothetical protein